MADEQQHSVESIYHMYQIVEPIYHGKNSTVFRARSKLHPQQNVILKMHKDDFPSTKARNKYYKEYNIGKMVNDGVEQSIVPEYFPMQKHGHSEVILMRDEGLRALADYLLKVCMPYYTLTYFF
jgi:serine/threonine protein kinase